MESKLTFITKRGPQIETVLDELASLRIAVFHDYPYLYAGTITYERTYLKTYSASERAFLFAVYEGSRMIGATTCIPLKDETAEVRKPFEDAGYDLTKICYFGESILLPEYRGIGLGHRFFDEREAYAKTFPDFTLTCFCSVNRAEGHPDKPVDYRPNDTFWTKRGYKKEQSLVSYMEWPDLGETKSSLKKMTYWLRSLH